VGEGKELKQERENGKLRSRPKKKEQKGRPLFHASFAEEKKGVAFCIRFYSREEGRV